MRRPNLLLCLPFALGLTVGVAIGVVLLMHRASVVYQGRQEASAFFYEIVSSFSEGEVQPDDGSIAPEALGVLEEHGRSITRECKFIILDSAFSGYEGMAFFPSGDIFYVDISRIPGGFRLNCFFLRDWDEITGN